MSYSSTLEFDIPTALRDQIVAQFNRMTPAVLSAAKIASMGANGDGQGVYQLFYKGVLVYIGKTDMEAGLRKRLLRHAGKINSRENISAKDVKFLALRIYVYSAMDLESSLISYYKKLKTPPLWNTSGFGSNDPGRQRDTSKVKENHFDSVYPIDLNWPVGGELTKSKSVADALISLKRQTPYLIRFQTNKNKFPHADLTDCKSPRFNRNESVRTALEKISESLGNKWQITALPGYVIAYKERKAYAHGKIIRKAARKKPAI